MSVGLMKSFNNNYIDDITGSPRLCENHSVTVKLDNSANNMIIRDLR